jgi:hypothetical protein
MEKAAILKIINLIAWLIIFVFTKNPDNSLSGFFYEIA